MAVTNLGMGVSPTSWTPARQQSAVIETPDEWKAKVDALQRQYSAQAANIAAQMQGVQPGKEDFIDAWTNDAANYASSKGLNFDNGWYENALHSMLDGGAFNNVPGNSYSPNDITGYSFTAPITTTADNSQLLYQGFKSGPMETWFDGGPTKNWVSAYNAAPDGSNMAEIQGLQRGIAAANASAQAAQDQYRQRLDAYGEAQRHAQNAYGQQLGGGYIGGILPGGSRKPGGPWTPDFSNVKGEAKPVNPTWGAWTTLATPSAQRAPGVAFGQMQQPGGLGGLGGPFSQKNAWSLT